MFDRDAPTAPAAPAGPVAKRARAGVVAPGLEQRLGRFLDDARALADSDLAGVSVEGVSRLLATQKRVDAAVAAWRSKLVAACNDQVLDHNGAANKAGLLKHRLGLSGAEAKRQATLADGLAELPGTSEALAQGRIGSDAARRIADAAAEGTLGDPTQVEASLLDPATRLDPDQLGRHIRRRQEAARSASQQQTREAEAQRQRSLTLLDRGTGVTEIRVLLPTLSKATFETALAAFTTLDDANTPDEHKRTWRQIQADAFVDMTHAALSAPTDGTIGRARPSVTVMIPHHVWAGDDGFAEINGQPVSGELARQACCDANISRLLAGPASQPLDVGREKREFTVAQRKAIIARDGHCRAPWCDRPAPWCHTHHVKWWKRDKGHTAVDNGLLLCGRHHADVHNGVWTVTLDAATGEATWTSRTGTVTVTQPEGPLRTILEEPPPTTGPPARQSGRSGQQAAQRPAPGRDEGWEPWRDGRPRTKPPTDTPERTADQLALDGTASRAP